MAEETSRPVGNDARPVVRFAPSPTGEVHLGTALSALFAFEAARALGARFLVRIEDIDSTRSRPLYAAAILDDLAWLGLEWEEPVRRQSEHGDDYRAAIGRLLARGLLYPCHASRGELAVAARGHDWPRDPDGALIHPGRGRVLAPETEAARRAAGEAPALRLDMKAALGDLAAANPSFTEIGDWAPATGRVPADPARWGDVVIARKDIATSYHLSVVVDDAIQGVTHVTRGLDLFEATHLHRLLQALLGLPVPVWCHHPLLVDASGRKLSKSAASPAISALRAGGATPADIRAAAGIARWRSWFHRIAGERVSNSFPG